MEFVQILKHMNGWKKNFDMKIIKVEMVDDYLYHLDCSIFPLTKDKTLICTELFNEDELAQLSTIY
jgi:N-dimethylarginine dimethylaminohydrolase